ncbi:MAG TPA: uroporphyrinogen decarboxylase family protein [Candidatus Limnocylindria bacterium]|nr:uroporphyrinogen decarboxylase family protein [Candidatus Limnocylindria bacterium]
MWAALSGLDVDRVPISFWGHFYHRESSAEELVEATLEHQSEYHWDWIKLNPRKHYHVEDWGVRYRYSGRAKEKPVIEQWPVHQPTDWLAITERPADQGALGEQIDAVRLLRRALPAEVPMIETVFTPLAVLGEMVSEPGELRLHMRTHPNAVRGALSAITATFTNYAARLIDAGADGVFFATTDWGSRNLLSAMEYREWGRPYDMRVLAAVKDAPFNVLHVCKRRNLLFEFADYPVRAFSWDATDPTNPTLADGFARLPGAVMGGISQEESLQNASPEKALAEYRRGLEQTGGRRWLVAPGCSIPPATPAANLKALRSAVETARVGSEQPGPATP